MFEIGVSPLSSSTFRWFIVLNEALRYLSVSELEEILCLFEDVEDEFSHCLVAKLILFSLRNELREELLSRNDNFFFDDRSTVLNVVVIYLPVDESDHAERMDDCKWHYRRYKQEGRSHSS